MGDAWSPSPDPQTLRSHVDGLDENPLMRRKKDIRAEKPELHTEIPGDAITGWPPSASESPGTKGCYGAAEIR